MKTAGSRGSRPTSPCGEQAYWGTLVVWIPWWPTLWFVLRCMDTSSISVWRRHSLPLNGYIFNSGPSFLASTLSVLNVTCLTSGSFPVSLHPHLPVCLPIKHIHRFKFNPFIPVAQHPTSDLQPETVRREGLSFTDTNTNPFQNHQEQQMFPFICSMIQYVLRMPLYYDRQSQLWVPYFQVIVAKLAEVTA